MKKKEFTKIGMFDSGVGGVSILKEILLEIKGDFIYLSDSLNNPYGDKKEKVVKEIIFTNIKYLISQNCNPIVIACNTATAVAIDELREKYPDIIFVGTEPAIKTVYDLHMDNKKTLFLSTKLTSESKRVKKLLDTYKVSNLSIYPAVGLADIIENNNNNNNNNLIDEYFNEHFIEYKNYDFIILGCTHYPLVKDKFETFFVNAQIIDSGKGVAKQLKKMIEINNFQFEKENIEFIDTSNNETKKDIFNYYLKK